MLIERQEAQVRCGGRVEVGAGERHLKTILLASETGKEPQAKQCGQLGETGEGRKRNLP